MRTLQYIIILIFISTYIYIYLKNKLKNKNKTQTEYILNYKFHNKKILSNFFSMYPNLSSREDEDVMLSLKQFFISNIESKGLILPSLVVYDFWTCFLSSTYEYDNFCKNAFDNKKPYFPTLKEIHENNKLDKDLFSEQLLMTFKSIQQSQKHIGNDYYEPSLFSLDWRLNIKDGFLYTPDIINQLKIKTT